MVANAVYALTDDSLSLCSPVRLCQAHHGVDPCNVCSEHYGGGLCYMWWLE